MWMVKSGVKQELLRGGQATGSRVDAGQECTGVCVCTACKARVQSLSVIQRVFTGAWPCKVPSGRAALHSGASIRADQLHLLSKSDTMRTGVRRPGLKAKGVEALVLLLRRMHGRTSIVAGLQRSSGITPLCCRELSLLRGLEFLLLSCLLSP